MLYTKKMIVDENRMTSVVAEREYYLCRFANILYFCSYETRKRR